jgi:ABC-type bacteriocin/lantibiotic exporter with double-glycine peptidase domain
LVFPYYYLGGEFLRTHISRKSFFIWLAATVVLAVAMGRISGTLVFIAIPITLLAAAVLAYSKKHRAKSPKTAKK